ncbi:MAG: MotA/TolQ/ExbB proton channel family protein [Planctomycetales bacterium]|nr:MotA/TolQ/ExbB proton channel family protein [Planctomycetales bacterium]
MKIWRGLMSGRQLSMTLLLALTLLVGNSADVAAQDGNQPPVGAETSGWSTQASTTPTADTPPSGSRNLLQVIRDGGPILLPIGACSIVLCIFVLERTISLRTSRVIPRPFVKRFIEQLQTNELQQGDAIQLCRENYSAVSDVFEAAIKKWGRTSVEVEQAVLDSGERVANGLRRYLRLFHGISTICPLMGLLGTVLGMISSFNTVVSSDAMGRPELLAAGISQALLTTAAGLMVAIPALVAHLYFVSRVDRLVMEIDALSQEVVNAIAADGWKEPADGVERTERRSRSARAKAA